MVIAKNIWLAACSQSDWLDIDKVDVPKPYRNVSSKAFVIVVNFSRDRKTKATDIAEKILALSVPKIMMVARC